MGVAVHPHNAAKGSETWKDPCKPTYIISLTLAMRFKVDMKNVIDKSLL